VKKTIGDLFGTNWIWMQISTDQLQNLSNSLL
jgi:hypothetical protein